MKIKTIVFLISLLIYLNITCKAQEYDSSCLKLSQYQIDPCLYELIATIAKSNKQYYDVDHFFYSLTFKKGKKSRYMSITPERWSDARFFDYAGIFKLKNITFLFRGDFMEDSIFKSSTLPQIEIKLWQEKDTAENGRIFIEPSLQGGYYQCKGMPIYIEIYTKGKIPNFKMKPRH